MNDAERALSQVERDQIQTYLVQNDRRAPWWQTAGFALVGGVSLAAMDLEPRWLAVLVALGVAAAIGALAGIVIRQAGAIPKLSGMPTSLRRVMIAYWAATMAGLAVIVAWAFTSDVELAWVRAGAMYFALVLIAGWIADRRYLRTARRLAERAGITRG